MKKQIILTYLASWIFFGILMLLTHQYHMDPNTFPAKLFLLAGGFAPSMVAILFFYNKWTGKKESSSFAKDLLKKILSAKSHVVFMVFIALILCSFLLASTFQAKESILSFISFWISSTFIYGGNGEIFWRGSLLEASLKNLSLMISAVVIGLLWGFWHLPLFFLFGMERSVPFLPFLTFTILQSIVLTVLRFKGSIFQSMILRGLFIAGFVKLEILHPVPLIIFQITVLIIALVIHKDIELHHHPSHPWDKFADIYDKFLNKERPAYQNIAHFITRYDSQLKTLELCAGTGILTEYIGDHFQDYEASDFSNEMLMNLKEKFKTKELKYSIIDCTNIAKEDRSYDLVIMANAIHILPDPFTAMQEVKRVLKPDGVFIVATFLRENTFKQRIQTKMMEIMGIKTVNAWSYQDYQKYFIENGWEIIKKEKIPAGFPIGYVELKKGNANSAYYL